MKIGNYITIIEKITPDPIPPWLAEKDTLLEDEIVTTEVIDFSDADTNLFLSLDIKYHVPAKVNNITNI